MYSMVDRVTRFIDRLSCLLGKHDWGDWYDAWMQDSLYKVKGRFEWYPIIERECKICHQTQQIFPVSKEGQ